MNRPPVSPPHAPGTPAPCATRATAILRRVDLWVDGRTALTGVRLVHAFAADADFIHSRRRCAGPADRSLPESEA